MTLNIGTIDRLLRALLGAALIALPFIAPDMALWSEQAYEYGAYAVGGVMLLTAALRFCPLYRLIGVRTCKT